MTENIDNSDLVIPFYDDIPKDAEYPCDTARLKYDKDDHRYYLTEAALSHYGIDYEPNEARRLIRTATDHVYSYIAVMALTKYNFMCYRLAKGFLGRRKSQKEGRLELERMLAKQAEYISDYGDAKRTPKMTVSQETGRLRDNDVDLSTGYWLHDEVLIWLRTCYLLDPNAIGEREVQWDKY